MLLMLKRFDHTHTMSKKRTYLRRRPGQAGDRGTVSAARIQLSLRSTRRGDNWELVADALALPKAVHVDDPVRLCHRQPPAAAAIVGGEGQR